MSTEWNVEIMGEYASGRYTPLPPTAHRLQRGTTVLGSDPACGVHLQHPSLAPMHLEIRCEGALVRVKALAADAGWISSSAAAAGPSWLFGPSTRRLPAPASSPPPALSGFSSHLAGTEEVLDAGSLLRCGHLVMRLSLAFTSPPNASPAVPASVAVGPELRPVLRDARGGVKPVVAPRFPVRWGDGQVSTLCEGRAGWTLEAGTLADVLVQGSPVTGSAAVRLGDRVEHGGETFWLEAGT